jgi:hypothetical protein
MIQGSLKRSIKDDIQDIFHLTDGGYSVYHFYLGKVSRLMSRPWGKKESKLSWGIFVRGGVWYWRDFATDETGNCISFVAKYFNINNMEAVNKILFDFKLSPSPVKITWVRPYEQEKQYIKIKFSRKPFTLKHHKFWNKVGVSEEHCEKCNCFAVKDVAFNGTRFNLKPDEIAFAYYAPEEDGVKLYLPERERKDKFRTNVSFHYIWNPLGIKSCDRLIVQKSNKDLIVSSMLFPNVVATQSESYQIFNDEVVSTLKQMSDDIWIWYGSDDDGVTKCKKVTKSFGFKYINTPKNLLPDVNDTYSMADICGIRQVETFMKTKKLII